MEINRALRGGQAKYNGNKVEIDCASLREIRLTSTRVPYFTEFTRFISTLFRLPAAAGISTWYFVLFSYHIQRSSSHLTRFSNFDCPEVSSHGELLSIEGSIPALVGRFGVEQARTHIVIHRDARTSIEPDTRYAPAVVDSISIGGEAIVNNQGGKF